MIESFSNRVMDRLTESQRLTDHTTPSMRDNAEITEKDWQRAWEVVAELLANKNDFLLAFGSLVTEAKSPEFIEPISDEVHIEELLAFRGPTVELVRNPASRFAYTVQTDSTPCCYSLMARAMSLTEFACLRSGRCVLMSWKTCLTFQTSGRRTKVGP